MRSPILEYKPTWELRDDYGILLALSPNEGYDSFGNKLESEPLLERLKNEFEFSREMGDFSLLHIEVSWESGYFTFHFALLGFHVGRSIGIK